ncbi:MAG: putative DNA binding domain-containing protein [Thermoflexales bacterium]|nr:putative DNA binding domain-containing protein [Thermoflexales bacterium]
MMTSALDQLQTWMDAGESEHLEFKEAKARYDFEELVKYCAALANEGGGAIILGVTDRPPRKIVGSQAFTDLERTKAGLVERLRLRIDAAEIQHPAGRVLLFTVPPRPVGVPIQYKGAYWMRAGQDLAPMTPDLLKKIFDEAGPDFSAEICPHASLPDLDSAAIEHFRAMWHRKSGNKALKAVSQKQLLIDAELTVNGDLTYAALILFGTHQALGKYLAQAELVFEYRSSEASLPAQQRKEYRQGFFLFGDDLWNTINLRNEVQQFQDGLFVWDIPTFNEAVVRETILNAVSHRDYRLAGSVFVRQFPRKLEVVSPGSFPPGITPDNILWRQAPRNRRISETFAKCGLVERSGQGVNRMFEECIKESKPRPDFAGTDDYQVSVTLIGEVQDQRFLRFLEQVGKERLLSFTTQDFIVLDLVNREQLVPDELKPRLPTLIDQGVIEMVGRGRGVRYILSRRFYGFLEKKGVYTRKRGLDRATNKALLLKHIQDSQKEGSQLHELMQVLPALSRAQIQTLLREMKAEGQIYSIGQTRSARWYPGRAPSQIASKRSKKQS